MADAVVHGFLRMKRNPSGQCGRLPFAWSRMDDSLETHLSFINRSVFFSEFLRRSVILPESRHLTLQQHSEAEILSARVNTAKDNIHERRMKIGRLVREEPGPMAAEKGMQG